mgnify:CR=1 FL=1
MFETPDMVMFGVFSARIGPYLSSKLIWYDVESPRFDIIHGADTSLMSFNGDFAHNGHRLPLWVLYTNFFNNTMPSR